MPEDTKGDYKSLDPVQDAMGTMGKWQIISIIAILFVNFPPAWRQLSNGFLSPDKLQYTCVSPKTASYSNNSCMAYVNDNITEECTQFKYDETIFQSTYISEWNLVCDKQYLASLIQTLTMLALLTGNMTFGVLADKIGRKIPLMIAVIVQTVAGVLSTFMPSYPLFIVLKFIADVATGGTMLVSFVIIMEIIGTEWRSKISMLFHVPFLLGNLSVPVIAYLTRTWRGYTLATSIPSIILWSYYWLVPESPRWLLAVGKTERAKEILKAAARKNGISMDKVEAAIESHENQMNKEVNDASERTYGLCDLLKTPNLRKTTICLVVNWVAVGFNFFGVNQYLSQLGGDIFMNYIISAVILLPALLIVYFLIGRISRLKILIAGDLLSGISVLLLIFFDKSSVQIYLASLGLSGSMVGFVTLYLYTGEVFPTVVRNVGMGLCSVLSKFASMIAPFITAMGSSLFWLPPLFYGVIMIISAGLCLFLPETMGMKLPDTIEDAENFRRKKKPIQLESVRL
ncbi:hypothetical protein PV327_002783 [Microctonus hyperodae]|uniref:Major facilitator superfamily (MFS) profile domain-containing protein n=1 Tax=Microctonus hyperodae TaxID=165561 RepID=A0AA39FG98_MICHY|nr:hypothetical protein PV327_002783 [Microctonus hyperodae]